MKDKADGLHVSKHVLKVAKSIKLWKLRGKNKNKIFFKKVIQRKSISSTARRLAGFRNSESLELICSFLVLADLWGVGMEKTLLPTEPPFK